MAPDSSGVSDDAVLLKTGKTWEEWFTLLDGAASVIGHRPAARLRGALADVQIAAVIVGECAAQAGRGGIARDQPDCRHQQWRQQAARNHPRRQPVLCIHRAGTARAQCGRAPHHRGRASHPRG